MRWLYHFPHAWPEPRQCWEDVWLRPDDPTFPGLGYFITVESFGYLAAQEDADTAGELERLRAEADTRLWIRPYDGSTVHFEVRVRAEDFSQEELVTWTRLFLQSQGCEADPLEEMGQADIDRCRWLVYGVPDDPV